MASHLPLPDATRDELMSLLRSHRKIEAIKRYRDATGAGLKEAKEAVERLEGGADDSLEAPTPDNRAGNELRTQLLAEIRAGRQLHAIKLYRDATGASLRDAKEAIDQLAKSDSAGDPGRSELASQTKSGCLPVLLVTALAPLTLLMLLRSL